VCLGHVVTQIEAVLAVDAKARTIAQDLVSKLAFGVSEATT